MSTTREELHRLVDQLPDQAVQELIDVVRELAHPTEADYEEVTDPDEVAIVLDALHDDPDEPEYTAEEAKRYLAERRRGRNPTRG